MTARLAGRAAGGLVAVCVVACSTDTTDTPQPSVTQIGDTTVIVPALDGPTGRLVSDLIIGADESNPSTIFGQLADAALGPDGGIYVVDNQASQVSVFSPDGQFIRLLSRRGEGPGEVEFPSRIAIADDGRVAVSSFVEVEVFTRDGDPASTQTVESRIQDPMRFDLDGHLHLNAGPVGPSRHTPWTVPGGGIAGIDVARGWSDFPLTLIELGADGEEIARAPSPFGLSDLYCISPDPVGSPNARICIGVAFGAYPWVDWLPDGRLIRAEADDFRIDIRGIGSEAGVTSIRPPRERLDIDGPLAAFIEDETRELLSGGGPLGDSLPALPTQKPAIAGLLPTRDGTLWVRLHAESERTRDDEDEETWIETESRFDIFTPEGEHVGYVTGPADLTVRDVQGDTVLTTRTGDFGVPIVERFVIEWQEGGT